MVQRKRLGKQLAQLPRRFLSISRVARDEQVRSELAHCLAARAAWRRRLVRLAGNRNLLERRESLRDGRRDGDSLRAQRFTVCRILDVAAAHDFPAPSADSCAPTNPRIRAGGVPGWGTNGAMATLPSFDQIAQAFSGFAQHSGGGPGFRPEIPYPGIADQSGAMNLAFGIMTALFVRERTGVAQKLEVSLLGTQIALQAPEILHYLHFGRERERDFRASPIVGHYECADRRWSMVVFLDQKFRPRRPNSM